MLIPGKGRLAIVLPYQILSGPQTYFVRHWLLTHTKIIAVIDLPGETFQPHTGTKTTLLVVERRAEPNSLLLDKTDYKIFMAVPKWIGHDRRGNLVLTKNGSEVLTDFDKVQESYDLYKNGATHGLYEACFIEKYSSILNDPLLRINSKFWKPNEITDTKKNSLKKKKGWDEVKIKDLTKSIFYPGRFKRNYVEKSETAIPFLGGADINEFIVHTSKWLSPETPNIRDLIVHKGWILITRSGTTGIVSSVPEAWEGYAMSEHVIRIIPDETKIEPEYLLAMLQSKHVQNILAKGIYGICHR